MRPGDEFLRRFWQVATALGPARGDGVQDCALLLPHDVCVADDLQLFALHARGYGQSHPGACGRGVLDLGYSGCCVLPELSEDQDLAGVCLEFLRVRESRKSLAARERVGMFVAGGCSSRRLVGTMP